MKTLTRADLGEAVHKDMGLSRLESARFVDAVIETIAERLAAGEAVRISGFGVFEPRDKGPRMGRNPKTRLPAPIPARRVAVFRPSNRLKAGVNERMRNDRGASSGLPTAPGSDPSNP